jgi:hypothetical protein
LDAFYEDVVQHLKAWAEAPPKLRLPEEPPAQVKPALVSTALSSQDGAEPAEVDEPAFARASADPDTNSPW